MKEYIKAYKWQMFWTGVAALLIHGAVLNSPSVGIDTEDLIHLGSPFYEGWLNTGRQGLVLLKVLTGSLKFNPYLAELMMLFFFAVSVTAFIMLWDYVSGEKEKKDNLKKTGTMLLWMAHPVLVEQFYFTLQGAEVSMGMLFTCLVLWLVYSGIRKTGFSKISAFFTGIVLLMITFSIYQIFVVLFIFGVVTLLLLDTLREREAKHKNIWKEVQPYVFVFLTAFAGNSLISAIWFSRSDYLSSQICWGQLSVKDCVYGIAVHVKNVLTGQDSVFYSGIYGLLCVMGLVLVLYLIKQFGWKLLFYYVALMTTPFLMTVVCADEPAIRSQLILPAATGFLLYLDGVFLKKAGERKPNRQKKKKVNPAGILLMILCVAGIYLEIQVSLGLYYTDSCRYAEDEALGRDLIQRLEPLIGEDDTPVVVIGSRPFHGNNACIKGEIIGLSVFEHDTQVEPRYYWSTRRVVGFLHTLGYDCLQLPDKNIPYAEAFAEEMDVWPAQNSVVHAGDMVVIKLSEINE